MSDTTEPPTIRDLLQHARHTSIRVIPGVMAYQSSNGQIVFDVCESDGEHLEAPAIPPNDRPRCRVYLMDMVPPEMRGKRGTFQIMVGFTPDATE